jgi:putative MATE family efflux protein
MQRPRSLTEGSISRGMFQFALPILFANILQSLNGSVNSIWVGRFLGEAALTATSNANTVMFLLIGAAFGIAMAATILVGQCIGANDLREAKHVVGTSATFFFLISVVMAVAGWILCEPLLAAMKTPPASLELAVAYMRVIFLALPSMYMYAFVMSVLRGAGDSKTPFYFMLLSVAIDIALNPVFIFGIGPIPKFGIAGSAMATLLAQTISFVALIRHLYRRKHLLLLHADELKLLRLNATIVGTLVKRGVPMGAQMLVVSLSGVLMIALVNRYGVETTAAFGASLQIWTYIQMPAFAVGMAVSAMAAQNVGAQKWDRVASVARVGVVFSVVLTGSIVLLIELADKHALGMFLPPASNALNVGSHINHLVTWSFVFFGVSMVLFGVVRATGAVMMPLLILTVTLLLVRFPAAALLESRYGADAVWWSFPVSSLLAAVLAVIYYKFGGWRSVRMLSAIGTTAPSPGGAPAGAPGQIPRGAPSAESATGT